MIQTSLDDALLGLAYLLNLNSAPSSERNKWIFYINSAVQRLYRSFDYEMAKRVVEVTSDAAGIIDLSDLEVGMLPAVEYLGTGSEGGEYINVPSREYSSYTQGDMRYRVVPNEDGEWEIHTTEPNATLTLAYFEIHDELSATQKACFTQMVIGKGALIYYRQASDPEADSSVEEDQFRQEVSEIMEAQNRRAPQRFAQTPRDRAGTYIGRS